jgi:hypothetical protein
MVAQAQGDYGAAAALHEEALERERGDRWGIAGALTNLGTTAAGQGDDRRAATLFGESLQISPDIGARGWVAAGRQPQRAARLGGAAAALREAVGMSVLPVQRAGHTQALQAVRGALGAEAFAAAWAAGETLPMEQAITEAFAEGH